MAKKILPALSLGLITVFAILFLTGYGNDDKESLRETFHVEAIYYDTGYVEVSYLDRSDQTNSVELEILGMEKSYHKIFSESEFIEIVQFPSTPKYGWAIHPVVFDIDHDTFGKIQLKTEIHPLGEPVPVVIYGKP